jgi:hypothetical protein
METADHAAEVTTRRLPATTPPHAAAIRAEHIPLPAVTTLLRAVGMAAVVTPLRVAGPTQLPAAVVAAATPRLAVVEAVAAATTAEAGVGAEAVAAVAVTAVGAKFP